MSSSRARQQAAARNTQRRADVQAHSGVPYPQVAVGPSRQEPTRRQETLSLAQRGVGNELACLLTEATSRWREREGMSLFGLYSSRCSKLATATVRTMSNQQATHKRYGQVGAPWA